MGERARGRKSQDTETPFDALRLLRAGGDAGTRGRSWSGRVGEWESGRKNQDTETWRRGERAVWEYGREGVWG